MKVLLVLPSMAFYPSERIQVGPPLGLAYIAAVLERAGIDVSILDALILGLENACLISMHDQTLELRGLDWKSLEVRIANEDPDIVGISCLFSSQAWTCHKLAKIVKKIDKDIITIMGGAHPSAVPFEVLKDENLDFVVIGEGEATVLDLVSCLEKDVSKKAIQKVKGIAYRDNREYVKTPRRPLIENLDTLPFPAHHLLPMKKYAKSSHGVNIKRKPFFSMITSRGCPGRCTFCSIHTIWGRVWRARSPVNVVDEIELLVDKYGVREIHFEDDNLTLDPRRMRGVCDEIIKRDIDITWSTPNGVRIDTLSRELLLKMKDSGCFSLNFGIESGDPVVRREIIKKPISIPHAKKVVEWCRQIGIWTSGFFILGMPGENETTFQKTIQLAKNLGLDSASFFIASPYPGTKLYETSLEKDYIQEINWEKLRVFHPLIETEDFKKKDLYKWRKKAYRAMAKYRISSPKLILHELSNISSFEDLSQYFRLLKRLLQILRT